MFIIVGIFNDEGPPVPIPNTEVKLICAEDTWLEAARKNRSMLTLIGHSNAKGPPVPIPNTEVKLCSADNTCLETSRKDRSWPISDKVAPYGATFVKYSSLAQLVRAPDC